MYFMMKFFFSFLNILRLRVSPANFSQQAAKLNLKKTSTSLLMTITRK